MDSLKTVFTLLRDTVKAFAEDNASRLAAALAYYTLFSIAPLLVIAIGIAGLVIGQNQAQDDIVAQIEANAGPQVAEALTGLIGNVGRPSAGVVATLVGTLVLIWGASQVMAQLKDSFNTIWRITPDPTAGLWFTIRQKLIALVMVLVLGLLTLLSLLVSTAIATFNKLLAERFPILAFLLPILDILTTLVLLTPLFALIFRTLPDTRITWRDVGPGALVTAALFLLGKFLIGWYLSFSGAASAYGAAGSLIVLLLWVYYSAQLLFLGAELTKTYTYRFGSRRSSP